MPLVNKVSEDGKQITIGVSGRFDFNVHRDFRDAYKDAANSAEFIVDLAGTEYMDSSALGMLLLLREYAGGDSAKIQIVNTRPEIKDILTIANFHKLFNIA